MEIEEIKEKIENKIVAVASVDNEGKAHNTPIMYAKVKDNKMIITDNYMKGTAKGAVVVNVEKVEELG